MHIVSGVVLFFLLWWTVIFVTLPFGNRRNVAGNATQTGSMDGHAGSAPLNPNMRRKIIATTIITTILWYPAYWGFRETLNNLRESARLMSIEDDSKMNTPATIKPIPQGMTNFGKNGKMRE